MFYSFNSGNWTLFAVLVGICIAVFLATHKEKRRRKKEGYYVSKRGGAEDGILFYNEGEQSLRLYFNRRQDTIYVPSDMKWKEIMPSWAKDRKIQIVSRIRGLIGKRILGKSWTYKETDDPDHVVSQ